MQGLPSNGNTLLNGRKGFYILKIFASVVSIGMSVHVEIETLSIDESVLIFLQINSLVIHHMFSVTNEKTILSTHHGDRRHRWRQHFRLPLCSTWRATLGHIRPQAWAGWKWKGASITVIFLVTCLSWQLVYIFIRSHFFFFENETSKTY